MIKEQNEKVEAANAIYKRRFLKAFFQESGAVADSSLKSYFTQHGLLDMEPILSDFEEYIMQIGVNASYAGQKPYEKTSQFLLTAWPGFQCGVETLDRYLKKQAKQDIKRSISRVFVATKPDIPNAVFGYYTLSTLSIEQFGFARLSDDSLRLFLPLKSI